MCWSGPLLLGPEAGTPDSSCQCASSQSLWCWQATMTTILRVNFVMNGCMVVVVVVVVMMPSAETKSGLWTMITGTGLWSSDWLKLSSSAVREQCLVPIRLACISRDL